MDNQQRKQFFQTFGYLVFPGLVRDEVDTITQEFETVFTNRQIVHNPVLRSSVVPFIDQRAYLCSLLDNPKILEIANNLLGDDFNYLGSDGNYYSGDTVWHSDGFHYTNTYMKIAFYLDPVTRDTGALRVIPGSHRPDFDWDVRKARQAPELWGIEQSQVPAVALESQPGDVVVFNHNIMHAAFGGGTRRRMFTINLGGHANTREEIEDLEQYINGASRFWIDSTYGEVMRRTASEQRERHFQQVLEHEAALPGLSAKARLEMSEPSRG